MKKHVDEYNAAVLGFKDELVEAYTNHLNDVTAAQPENLLSRTQWKNIMAPVSHEKEYARIIGMLNFDINEYVDLDETEYQHYIQDEWSWTAVVALTNAAYANKYNGKGSL